VVGGKKERSKEEEGGVSRGVGVSGRQMEWCGVAGYRTLGRMCDMSVDTEKGKVSDIKILIVHPIAVH
jgi:hypothetical protein